MLFEAFFSVAESQKQSYSFRFTVIVFNRYTIQKQTFLGIPLRAKTASSPQTPPTLRK